MEYRDIRQKQQKQLDEKLNRRDITKAVITDEFGNDSGTGTIWANQNTRCVWIREAGSASISRVPCYTITPEIGLGVIVGYDLYSDIREVLRTDRDFLGQTNATGTSYESPSHLDLQAGGRLQLWVASKLIEPLATYPDATGLVVNVVSGDYTYAGTRKTFAGQTGITLTQNPNPGEHYYAGLYLDATNTLQTVYGASVVLATTPPEPTWSTGAFLLSVVRINDTQTSINFSLDTNAANDILDRRMSWSDSNILGVPATGAIITGDTTPEWTVLSPGTSGQYVTPNSTTGELEWRDIPTVGITEFLYDLASDIATYFQLDTDIPTGGSQTIVSAAISASNTLIFNLATNPGGPGVDFINDGVWHLHLHAQKSGPGTKDVTLKFRVYYRTDPGGVETQIGTGYSESTVNLTTSVVEYDLHLALDEISIATTDRIVLKIYADISGAGTDPTVTLTVEGTTDSRLEIPALISGMGSGGWPNAGKAMINNMQYDTVQLAIDAMLAGDIIKVGQGTDSGGIVPDTAGSIVGLSPVETIIIKSDNDSITVNNSAAANLTLENLTISQTGAGTSVSCIKSNQDGLRLDNLDILKESGAPTTSIGVDVYGGSGDGTYLLNCRISVTTGTNKYGVYTSTAANAVIIEGGEINAATADIYIGHASSVVELRGVKLLGGVINATTGTLRGEAVDDKGRDCGQIVKNTSSATVNRGDIGYINEDGEFKTTTTANNFTGAECIVTVGGPNNGWIFVRRTGNATVNYTGSAPNAGDYLVTSTTAGVAQAQATMRPEVFAVCLAAGSGGQVEVKLLCNTVFLPLTSSNRFFRVDSHSNSDFVATINGAPSTTSVVYNAPSAGSEDIFSLAVTPHLAKIRLYNSTRGTYRLVTSVNQGTNTITTESTTDAWANGDTITVQSQTITPQPGTAHKYIDLEIVSEIPQLARAVGLSITKLDSGVGSVLCLVHPYEAFNSAKQTGPSTTVAVTSNYTVALIERRVGWRSSATGSSTATDEILLAGVWVAAP